MAFQTKLAAFLGLIAFGAGLAHGRIYSALDQFDSTTESYDFIIVGGGVGGSVLANRLSENPRHNVLLIEAGPNNEGVVNLQVPNYFFQINSTYSWGYTTTSQAGLNNRSLPFTQGHVLGGSSSVNGMIYTRGSSDDFDLWGKLTGDRRWSWKNLFPYFLRNEKLVPPPGGRNASGQYDPRYHSSNGLTSVSLPWGKPTDFDILAIKNADQQKEIKYNIDVNSGKPSGLIYVQATIGDGERSSAAIAYLNSKVRERPNLTILLNTFASRVLPVKESRQLDVRTVEISPRAGGKTTTVTAKKELIVTAGAFGTPRLLLNSGIGDKEALNKVGVKAIHHLPDVGKGSTDHITVSVSFTANDVFVPVDNVAAFDLWKNNRTGPLTEAVGHQLIFARIPANASLWKDHPDPSSGPNSPHIELTLFSSGPVVTGFIVLLTPKSRGSVRIRSNNPLDDPLIDPGFLTHPFDILAVKEGIQMLKRWYQGPAYKGYITGFAGPDPDILSEKDFSDQVKALAGTFWHPVGTAAMSPKGSKHGVVDPELRVKGIKGLRVVDSSAIPYVPTAHTQASVYVLSERVADLIKEAW